MAANKYLPHHPAELARLLKLAGEAKSILEIGSRFGECLTMMAYQMKKGRVVSVDMPNMPPWGEDSQEALTERIESLKAQGFDAHLFIGDSGDGDIISAVHALGPYDLIFIDGDHRYEGVRADWENYGSLGKVVVFHDIVPPKAGERQELGVWRLWKEIQGKKTEFIGDGSKMGLGIVER